MSALDGCVLCWWWESTHFWFFEKHCCSIIVYSVKSIMGEYSYDVSKLIHVWVERFNEEKIYFLLILCIAFLVVLFHQTPYRQYLYHGIIVSQAWLTSLWLPFLPCPFPSLPILSSLSLLTIIFFFEKLKLPPTFVVKISLDF